MTVRIAVAVAALLAVAAPASARPPLDVGLQDDSVFLTGVYGVRGGLAPAVLSPQDGYAAAEALGVTALRINVRWADVTSRDGGVELDGLERAVVAANNAGIRPQLSLTGPAPAWATADGRTGNDRPDARAYGRFASAVATALAGRVERYSVWNEPNWHGLLAPQHSAPGLYRRLYAAASAAIHAADPQAQVLVGELAPLGRPEAATPPLRFLRALTCSRQDWSASRPCRPLVADGFALHPYALRWTAAFPGVGRDDVTTGSLPRLEHALAALARRRALVTSGGRALALYLTEYGAFAQRRGMPSYSQADALVNGFEALARDPHVREVVQYQLAATPGSGRWDTALIDGEGRPRPSFFALRDWVAAQR